MRARFTIPCASLKSSGGTLRQERARMADQAEHGAGHQPGSMDIAEQQRTFAGFTKACTYVIVVVAVILILLSFRA